MTEMTSRQLARVTGGADSFGRCGPGNAIPALGNYYTPECKVHDQAVRTALNGGSTYLEAQLKALPELPAAVGSWFRARFG